MHHCVLVRKCWIQFSQEITGDGLCTERLGRRFFWDWQRAEQLLCIPCLISLEANLSPVAEGQSWMSPIQEQHTEPCLDICLDLSDYTAY